MAKKSAKPAFSLISNETLKQLHRDLVKSRQAAAGGRGVFNALPSAVLMDLGAGDTAVTLAPDAVLKFKRAGKPAVLVASFAEVLGAGLLAKTGKSGKVSVVFGADSKTPEWKAALEAAKRHWLPVIFVSRACGVDEAEMAREIRLASRSRISAKTLLADGYLPRIHVDANDAVAVYRVAHESIDRARRGRGPTWIEGVPFAPEGVTAGTDAVAAMETYLRGKGFF